MNVAVIIPVGPGHEECAKAAIDSVAWAWKASRGPFDALRVDVVDDTDGRLGRSRARNLGMDRTPADWHFLLDADDLMLPGAFGLVDLSASATFGAVCLDGRIAPQNRWPVTRETILRHGADGTLSMGCFVRGDLGVRFDPEIEQGEDFDFYLRLPGFTKRQEPLVSISYHTRTALRLVPSRDAGWREACAGIIRRYRETVR